MVVTAATVAVVAAATVAVVAAATPAASGPPLYSVRTSCAPHAQRPVRWVRRYVLLRRRLAAAAVRHLGGREELRLVEPCALPDWHQRVRIAVDPRKSAASRHSTGGAARVEEVGKVVVEQRARDIRCVVARAQRQSKVAAARRVQSIQGALRAILGMLRPRRVSSTTKNYLSVS